MNAPQRTVPLRAALYLRVSTARQAEHDVTIPDQQRQDTQRRARRDRHRDLAPGLGSGYRVQPTLRVIAI